MMQLCFSFVGGEPLLGVIRRMRGRLNVQRKKIEWPPGQLEILFRRPRETTVRVRPRSVLARRLTRDEIEFGKELHDWRPPPRPRVRADCDDSMPCPWVGCRYHLYLDVNPVNGSVKYNFPDLDVDEIPETCAMRVADRGATTIEAVGKIMNLTDERIRYLEALARVRLKQELVPIRIVHRTQGETP